MLDTIGVATLEDLYAHLPEEVRFRGALNIPPGIYRNGTEYQAKGRYYDSNLVRFFAGTIRAGELEGTDYADASVRLQNAESLFQATLAASARLVPPSLIDFLN